MKILLESGDEVCIQTDDGQIISGTVTNVVAGAFILKIGSGADDFEAFDVARIKACSPVLGAGASVYIFLIHDDGVVDTDFGNVSMGPISYIPLNPSRNKPPVWDDIQNKWHHLVGGDCICGCRGGGATRPPLYRVAIGSSIVFLSNTGRRNSPSAGSFFVRQTRRVARSE